MRFPRGKNNAPTQCWDTSCLIPLFSAAGWLILHHPVSVGSDLSFTQQCDLLASNVPAGSAGPGLSDGQSTLKGKCSLVQHFRLDRYNCLTVHPDGCTEGPGYLQRKKHLRWGLPSSYLSTGHCKSISRHTLDDSTV